MVINLSSPVLWNSVETRLRRDHWPVGRQFSANTGLTVADSRSRGACLCPAQVTKALAEPPSPPAGAAAKWAGVHSKVATHPHFILPPWLPGWAPDNESSVAVKSSSSIFPELWGLGLLPLGSNTGKELEKPEDGTGRGRTDFLTERK